MKVYISVDIEGTTGIAHWNETERNSPDYKAFQEQMTNEAVAACEGALKAGATEIYIKDAHGSGRNLITSRLPEEVRIIRGWAGIRSVWFRNSTIHLMPCCLSVIIHAPGQMRILAHTLRTAYDYININGVYASEFYCICTPPRS